MVENKADREVIQGLARVEILERLLSEAYGGMADIAWETKAPLSRWMKEVEAYFADEHAKIDKSESLLQKPPEMPSEIWDTLDENNKLWHVLVSRGVLCRNVMHVTPGKEYECKVCTRFAEQRRVKSESLERAARRIAELTGNASSMIAEMELLEILREEISR